MQSTSGRAPTDGFYCSTSEAYFPSKEALAEHYRSDFHRWLRLRAAKRTISRSDKNSG